MEKLAGPNERLAAWMMLQRMTDAQLADKLGLDRTYIWMLRVGRRELSNGFRWRFGTVYGFQEAESILGESVQRQRKQPATANGEG